MEIKFFLSKDVYLQTDWDSKILPQKGDLIKLKGFLKDDSENLYCEINQPTSGLSCDCRFESFKCLRFYNLDSKSRITVNEMFKMAKHAVEDFIQIKSNPHWEMVDGSLIASFTLNINIEKKKQDLSGYL